MVVEVGTYMPKTLEPVESRQDFISIGEAAERAGITQRTLRYWEDLGLLKPPARVSGGQRLYSRDDLVRIDQILRMKKLLGFSLSEIKLAVESEEAKQVICKDLKHERSRARRLKQLEESAGITERQLRMVEEKIKQMQVMKKELARDLSSLNERIAELREGVQGTV